MEPWEHQGAGDGFPHDNTPVFFGFLSCDPSTTTVVHSTTARYSAVGNSPWFFFYVSLVLTWHNDKLRIGVAVT